MKSATLLMAEKHMRESGIPVASVARIVGISPTLLRSALREEYYLGAQREARVQETASAILRLKQSLDPLDLPRRWEDLKKLLAKSPGEISALVDQMFNG